MEKQKLSVPEMSRRKIIAHYISLGVDYISSGALTHSAPIMDVSLKNLHVI